MQNVGLYLRDEFYTCSLQSCILLTQLKEGMHEVTAAQNVQCMHMAPVVLAGSNNKVTKVLWELICFTITRCFLCDTLVMRHLSRGHQLGLKQLILICTKCQNCFLITDRYSSFHALWLFPFFMRFSPVSFLIFTQNLWTRLAWFLSIFGLDELLMIFG